MKLCIFMPGICLWSSFDELRIRIPSYCWYLVYQYCITIFSNIGITMNQAIAVVFKGYSMVSVSVLVWCYRWTTISNPIGPWTNNSLKWYPLSKKPKNNRKVYCLSSKLGTQTVPPLTTNKWSQTPIPTIEYTSVK